jgi:peptide deformylase
VSTRKSKQKPVQHAGRVTVTECKARGNGSNCEPLNRVTIYAGGKVKDHCTCVCGRRYPTSHPDAPEHLVDPLGPIVEVEPGASADWPADMLSTPDEVRANAVPGVVPIETPALHVPTRPVGVVTDEVKALAKQMVKVMHAAPGVGLAGNQVGMPVRMFVQLHKRAAPETLIDPEIRATAGTWGYQEGCLSIEVEGVRADVTRPQRIQVRARTLHGETVEITADEVLARIFQHEIDHLDGNMYVQRLEDQSRDVVYRRLEDAGIDTTVIPPRPY